MLKIGLDTESLHLWFQNKRMDILGFIEKAHEFGFDGVMINILKDFNLDPEWGTLESNAPEHLTKVRTLLDKYNMYVELATKGIGYDHLVKVLDVAEALGADIVRTYIPITLNPDVKRLTGAEGKYDQAKVKGDFDPIVFEEASKELYKIIPELKKRRIKIGLENHEYEIAQELVDVVKKINSPWIGLHYDFGNSMMAWEEPEQAAELMAPYTVTTHFKDHIIIPSKEEQCGYVVCGVPAGTGNLDLKKLLKIILDGSTITRLNMEMCYPYCAQFKRTPGTGGVLQVGDGSFVVREPLFDPDVVKPGDYYYPQEISEELLEKCLKLQMDGVKASAEFTRKLCKEYETE